MSKEMELLDAIMSLSTHKSKSKSVSKLEPKLKKKPKKEASTQRVPSGYLLVSKEELLQMLEEAVRRGIEEGLKRAREVTEENLIKTIWNGEPSGVKLSNLILVFGREASNEIQQMLLRLQDKGILVKDRNGWWHINPVHAEVILEHYGIEYSQEEVEAVRERLRRRVPNWNNLPEPQL